MRGGRIPGVPESRRIQPERGTSAHLWDVSLRTRDMRRLILVAILAAGTIVTRCGPAHACSCVQADSKSRLESSEAAFIGTLISKGSPKGSDGMYGSGEEVPFRFRVNEVAKGDLPREIDVWSANSGASCGLEVGVGETSGIFLYRQGDRWTSGLCSQVDPESLRQAAGGHGPSGGQPSAQPSERPPSYEPGNVPSIEVTALAHRPENTSRTKGAASSSIVWPVAAALILAVGMGMLVRVLRRRSA